MNTRPALALVAVLVLISSATTASAVAPGSSLAAEFDSSPTATNTVVVAVADTATIEGQATLMAANAIAHKNDYTVVRVPDGTLPPSVIQTLSQRVKYGELRYAIVVGAGDKTEAVAQAINNVGADVGGDTVTIDVKDEITGDTPADLLQSATIQSWASSDAAFLTTTAGSEPAKISVAVANGNFDDPVLAQSMGYSDLNATLNYLGASTVYVTPGISDSTRNLLQDDGYTVATSASGVSLDQSVQDIAVGYAPDSAEDVVVVGRSKDVHAVGQTGIGASSAVLVTEDSDTLGTATENQLSSLTAVENVYVFGNTDDVSEDVFSNVSSTVRDAAVTSRVDRVHGYTETSLRASLLTAGYTYGVLTSHVQASGENVSVDITNIGYSTVLTVDNVSVAARFEGSIESSTPQGHQDSGEWVVRNDDEMDPGDTFTVELKSDSVKNAGHPELDYYVGESGGLVGAASGFGFFIEAIQDLPGWLSDLVDSVIPTLNLDTNNPLVLGGMVVALVLVALGVTVSFRRYIQT